MKRWFKAFLVGCFAAAVVLLATLTSPASPAEKLSIQWADDFLTIDGPALPGPIRIHYLEAYCRPGSTDRDWRETVIGHQTDLISAAGGRIRLRDRLKDGVVVEHVITPGTDEVDFRLIAHNPSSRESQAHWAQPCIRVDRFTGAPTADARTLYPEYIRQCFLFLEGRLTRLPTQPWASQARYTPGQVYAPRQVSRDDVNPRPLSSLVPSNGLTGCFSKDERMVMAVAWEPYQEIFQGVITCLHSDFRIGGLQPGQTKQIRGKIYIVPADIPSLLRRYQQDFPEHTP